MGAGYAALALHALAEVMERARIGRLTRFQHILLRLGEWIAYAECAGSLARRAARMAEGQLNEKANQRFDAAALAAIARIFAREAALKVAAGRFAVDRRRRAGEAPAARFARHSPRPDGLVSDMDFVADVLYGRAAKAAARVAIWILSPTCSTAADAGGKPAHGRISRG